MLNQEQMDDDESKTCELKMNFPLGFYMKCIRSGEENIYCDHLSPEPGPAATMVGNIVMGTRIGGAAGREIADIEEDSDMARKVLTQIQYPYPLIRIAWPPPHLAKNNSNYHIFLYFFFILRPPLSFH